MASRMDRYKNENNSYLHNRSDKNKELYDSIGSNTKYTNFTDVRDNNAYVIDNNSDNYTRESYHHMKEYRNVMPKTKVRKELDDFNHLYHTDENKVYDINSVLEKAREARKNKDSENFRKLKNTNYNILASINPEELEKYREEKKNRLKPEKEEMKELIDTMISKTLAGEISKQTGVDLLSDLMATSAMDRVPNPNEYINDEKEKEKPEVDLEAETKVDIPTIKELVSESKEELNSSDDLEDSQDLLDSISMRKIEEFRAQEPEPVSDTMKDLDKSFYTKSMDLSDKDFFIEDEDSEKKVPTFIKVLLFVTLVALISIGVYFIYQSI